MYDLIFGGRKGAALLFIGEYVFGGTLNAQFQSLFCQNLYNFGIARGQRGPLI